MQLHQVKDSSILLPVVLSHCVDMLMNTIVCSSHILLSYDTM